MDTIIQKWWYEQDGEQRGPVSEAEIINLINSGFIKPETLVWKQGIEHWVFVKNSPFAQYFRNNKPPPITGDAVNNTIIWWLAFAPILGLFLEGFFIGLFYPEPNVDYENTNSIMNYDRYFNDTNFDAFWFVTLALNFFLCYQDEKKLEKAGYDVDKLGSTFLVPVYLYKRAEMLKQNNAYFWVWLILFIIVMVA